MTKTFAILAFLLMTSACAGREKPQLVADPALIPAFPAAPVRVDAPLPRPMLPQIKCLQETGAPSCPGAGLSPGPKSTISSFPK